MPLKDVKSYDIFDQKKDNNVKSHFKTTITYIDKDALL